MREDHGCEGGGETLTTVCKRLSRTKKGVIMRPERRGEHSKDVGMDIALGWVMI